MTSQKVRTNIKKLYFDFFGFCEITLSYYTFLRSPHIGCHSRRVHRCDGDHPDFYTSFITINVTFEVWILFGIIIIMNSKSNFDSALKCFVSFLISQPPVYLIRAPFSRQGWKLFGYYKYRFAWTVLCFSMGYIGYWMKKDNRLHFHHCKYRRASKKDRF